MENIIIGTAGHVDHGKTSLIKALSGFDTDRLKEEKKRGITIENGFANLPNDKGYHLGIIDVPGHEKFVKNMLAGIGGIDIVLLVISLEEGIKPQTIEHFEILKLLGIKKGIIVFTKLDSENKVDFENLTVAVKDLCKGSFLENAKMICVSSWTGQNIDVLKELIFENVKDVATRRSQKELARLPIDRVFTMEGFGTVVTGTLMEGQIDTSDELMVYPQMKVVKVRQLESHSKVAPSAFAGQRTAINFLNVKKEEINRGDVLAAKSSIILSSFIECKLMMFKSATRKIKNGERVHFNYGSAQVEATIKLVENDDNYYNNIKDVMYVYFRFDKPIPVKRGDKYIIRFVSPVETCGGGVILNVDAKKRKIDEELLKHFEIMDSGNEEEILKEIINECSFDFSNIEYIARKMNIVFDDAKSMINTLEEKNLVVCIKNTNNQSQFKNNVEFDKDTIVISNKFFEGINKYVIDVLNKFHKDNPILKGMKKEELKSILFKRYNRSGDTVLENIINYLVKENVVKKYEELVANVTFNVVIDDKKSKTLNAIENKYKVAGYELPDTQNVVDEMSKGRPSSYKLEVRQMILDLAKNNKLVKLSKEYYIHKEHYDNAYNILMKHFETNDKILMRDMRDMLNTSRKYAILIMDYFDQKRITKLIDDYRVLYKK